jgi:hypothetical protein
VRDRFPAERWAVVAAFSVAFAIAGTPHALAKPSGLQDSSFRPALEGFAVSVKAESEGAIAAAAALVGENEGALAEIKGRLGTKRDTLRVALSERKERLAILRKDAAASLDAWRQEAAKSWGELQRSTADALAKLSDYMRKRPKPSERPDIHV